MQTPLISFLLPVYNTEQYLNETLFSIRNQTHKNIEIIIVNDGSTDKSEKIIQKHKSEDRRIIYIKKDNTGIVDTLNFGIKYINGYYTARIDADDICHHQRVSNQLKYLKKHKLDLCGSAIKQFGRRNKIIKYPLFHDELATNLCLFGKSIAHPTLFCKTEVLKNHNYSKKYPHAEDLALWLDINYHSNYKMGNCPEVLIKYRTHQNQISKNNKNAQKELSIKAISYFLEKHIPNITSDEIKINNETYLQKKCANIDELIIYTSLLKKISFFLIQKKINTKYIETKIYDICYRSKALGPDVYNLYKQNIKTINLKRMVALKLVTLCAN